MCKNQCRMSQSKLNLSMRFNYTSTEGRIWRHQEPGVGWEVGTAAWSLWSSHLAQSVMEYQAGDLYHNVKCEEQTERDVQAEELHQVEVPGGRFNRIFSVRFSV